MCVVFCGKLVGAVRPGMLSPGEGSNVFALIPLADMKHFGRELRFWSEAGSTSLFHTSSMPNAIFVRIQLEASGGGRASIPYVIGVEWKCRH